MVLVRVGAHLDIKLDNAASTTAALQGGAGPRPGPASGNCAARRCPRPGPGPRQFLTGSALIAFMRCALVSARPAHHRPRSSPALGIFGVLAGDQLAASSSAWPWSTTCSHPATRSADGQPRRHRSPPMDLTPATTLRNAEVIEGHGHAGAACRRAGASPSPGAGLRLAGTAASQTPAAAVIRRGTKVFQPGLVQTLVLGRRRASWPLQGKISRRYR
jgi:hypothetical protein